jgi:hypothetical protein
MIKIIIKRLIRRLKYAFLFRDLFWKYESCQDCGHCFRLVWSVKDEIWDKVMGSGDGLLCLDCFISRAEKKKVPLSKEDFDIAVFLP